MAPEPSGSASASRRRRQCARRRGGTRRRATASSAPRAPAARGAGACRRASARRPPARPARRARRRGAPATARRATQTPAEVEAQIDGHLLVARPSGVQALAGLPDALRPARAPPTRARPRRRHRRSRDRAGRAASSSASAALDRRVLGGREHARAVKRLGPRKAARDVVLDEPAIERKRSAERENVLVGLSGEPAGPEGAHGLNALKTEGLQATGYRLRARRKIFRKPCSP